MKHQQAKVIVNRTPKLLHGELIIRHPNGNTEVVRLCDCCQKDKEDKK